MKRSLGQCGASADATAPQGEKRAPGRPPNKRKKVIQECKGVPGGCGGGRCSKKLYTADLCRDCWGVKHPRRHMKTRELDAQQQSKKRRKERQHPFHAATLRSSKPLARSFYSVDVCCGGGMDGSQFLGWKGCRHAPGVDIESAWKTTYENNTRSPFLCMALGYPRRLMPLDYSESQYKAKLKQVATDFHQRAHQEGHSKVDTEGRSREREEKQPKSSGHDLLE